MPRSAAVDSHDDRCRGARPRGVGEGARDGQRGRGGGRRLPGRPRGVRRRRPPRHARLPRVLRARGPGGPQLRRARQAHRQRPRDHPRTTGATPPACPYWFDYEGVAKQGVVLVEAGLCRGVVHDSQTAARAGVASTGHGLPAPNPYGPFPLNMVMEPGTVSRDELDRRPGARPAGHPLPLHEPGPPQARDRHRDDPRRNVPGRGRPDRRAGQEPAVHPELPGGAGGTVAVGRERPATLQRVPRRGRRAGRPDRQLDVHGQHGALGRPPRARRDTIARAVA